MAVNRKDLVSGMFFMSVGLLYGGVALFQLPMGNAVEMGPGYFPIVLSGALLLLGLIIAGRAYGREKGPGFGIVRWRSVVMLSAATIVFATFIDELGMLPGVFVATLLAALASPQMRLLRAIAISVLTAAFCTVVFSYAIGLPVPVFGPLFGG